MGRVMRCTRPHHVARDVHRTKGATAAMRGPCLYQQTAAFGPITRGVLNIRCRLQIFNSWLQWNKGIMEHRTTEHSGQDPCCTSRCNGFNSAPTANACKWVQWTRLGVERRATDSDENGSPPSQRFSGDRQSPDSYRIAFRSRLLQYHERTPRPQPLMRAATCEH